MSLCIWVGLCNFDHCVILKYVSVADLGILKGGQAVGGPEENLKFMMLSRPIFLNFCQHLTTRRAMNVNELSSISKTISCELKVTLLLLQ